jgi:protein-disulfide isomerase/transcription elongation factor Elf1
VSETCPICDSEFAGQPAVRDHTWDAHGACHLCGDGFEGREALYEHWLASHESALHDESRKRAETSVGTRTVCPTCDDRLGSEDAVRAHSWDAHGTCHHCGGEFDDKTALHAHWLSAHADALQESDRRRAEQTVSELSLGERLTHLGPAGTVSRTEVSRRSLLGGGAIASLALLGGAAATGLNGGGSARLLAEHPAGAALSAQPTLGPEPGTAEGTIIAFEDPSCPSCARFELTAFPKLKSRLIDPGRVSFVFRPLPVVAPWGESASLALESVQARDESAFWGLKEFYYENQRSLESGNVLDATRKHLDGTSVEADGVVQDVRESTHQDEIDTNLRVADQAGVRGTPTFYLFDTEGFVTQFTGAQSYSVFTNSLGV